ncbi:MAG: methyltransferase domain-containing protein [Nevskia sp.]|nr:methyltransferase domain-containing protein [Nevskia sp.]
MCSLHEEANGEIAALLGAVAGTHRRILDYGCGVGGYLPLLSQVFGEVVAVDSSGGCVEKARQAARALRNVEVYPTGELARRSAGRAFDALLMANVLIHPDEAVRSKILRLALARLRRGGVLILVVPAIESVHLAEAVRRAYAPRRKSSYTMARAGKGFAAGVVGILGHPTKHYAADELTVYLESRRLRVNRIARAEYSWRSESFEALDRKLRQRPWDWLVCATRR